MTLDDIHSRRIAEILEGFGEAFIAFGFDWRIAHCNRAAELHFGFKRQDVLNQVIWDLVPGRDGPLYGFLHQVMASRQPAEREVGSDVHPGRALAMRAFPLETGIGVSWRDITERRERIRREREQTERLELALAAAGLGDWSWDAGSDIVTFSERAAQVWGMPAGPHMTWTGMQQLIHPDDRDRVRKAVEDSVAGRRSYEVEYRIRRADDGAERWVMVRARGQYDEDDAPVGMLGVLADITGVKAEEALVRADRERLAELERRRAFLLETSDTLRDMADPDAILTTAARLLGERLGVGRVGYAELAADDATVQVIRDWTRGGVSSLAGRSLDLEALGPQIAAELRTGRSVIVADALDDPRWTAFIESHAPPDFRSSLTLPLIRNGRFDAIVFAHDDQPRAWSGEDLAVAEDVAARTWSSLARARFERALRESEARFRAMADSAPAPVWVTSAAGPIEFVNRAFCDVAGKPLEALLGDAWIGLMHPDDRPAVAAVRAEARRDLVAFEWTARFRRHDGEWRWMHANSQPRFDAHGTFQGYVGLAVDVTETRRAEDRQRLLINELNHRVKNTLATVQSLAHQTLREGEVTRDARGRLTDRLLALSAAHNVLTRQNWEAAELGDIVREAVRPYDDAATSRVSASGPVVRLSPNAALALSMAMHELATNAVKYGALCSATGRVSIAWALTDGVMSLEWREAGGPPVEAPRGRGFGSRLLRDGLITELGAPAELSFEPTGLVCRLTARLA